MPGLAVVPGVQIAADAILFIAVAFLQLAFELLPSTVNLVEVVVSEFAPLFPDLALHLLPVAFNTVPIHSKISFVGHGWKTTGSPNCSKEKTRGPKTAGSSTSS